MSCPQQQKVRQEALGGWQMWSWQAAAKEAAEKEAAEKEAAEKEAAGKEAAEKEAAEQAAELQRVELRRAEHPQANRLSHQCWQRFGALNCGLLRSQAGTGNGQEAIAEAAWGGCPTVPQ